MSQILTHSNVRSGSRLMVVESCNGLLLGAMLERMAGIYTELLVLVSPFYIIVQCSGVHRPSRPCAGPSLEIFLIRRAGLGWVWPKMNRPNWAGLKHLARIHVVSN